MFKILLGFAIFLVLAFVLSEYPALLLIPLAIGIFLICKAVMRRTNQKNQQLIAEAQEIEWIKASKSLGELHAQFYSCPHDFEVFIAKMYQFLGFDTTVTQKSNDGGKDIVMYKNGEKYVVEVKLYGTYDKISREKVQKLHSAMMDERANHAIFVTTSSYTAPAVEFAERNEIELIDGIQLMGMINHWQSSIGSQN